MANLMGADRSTLHTCGVRRRRRLKVIGLSHFCAHRAGHGTWWSELCALQKAKFGRVLPSICEELGPASCRLAQDCKQHRRACLQRFIDSKSPWQQGRTERAGGAVKDILLAVAAECGVVTQSEMEVALTHNFSGGFRNPLTGHLFL